MHNTDIANKNKSLLLLHINACSFHKNCNDLQNLLICMENNFDILQIPEIQIII